MGTLARTSPSFIGGMRRAQKTIPLLEGGYQCGTTVATSVEELPNSGPLAGRKAILIQNQHGSNSVYISATKPVSLKATGTYEWILSGSGTNEWYVRLKAGGGDPGLTETKDLYTATSGIFQNDELSGATETAASNGTVGSLTLGQWDWGDNDSLGYSTVYVRTDGTVPHTYFKVIYSYYRRPALAGALVGFRLSGGESVLLHLSGNTRIFAIASASALVSTLEFE